MCYQHVLHTVGVQVGQCQPDDAARIASQSSYLLKNLPLVSSCRVIYLVGSLGAEYHCIVFSSAFSG